MRKQEAFHIISCLLLLCLMISLFSCSDAEYQVILSEEQINRRIAGQFPYAQNIVVASIELVNPLIEFVPNGMELKMDYSGHLLSTPITGAVLMTGHLKYDRESGNIYLNNFEIQDIVANSNQYDDSARIISTINKVLGTYLETFPVYRISSDDIQQSLVKLFLKEVKMEQDQCILILGV